MAFASRSDLLARSNARRLAQLAVPADMDMVPDEALRAAIAGSDLSAFSQAEQAALALALEAIDKALADADALILSYGIPDTVQTTLLARSFQQAQPDEDDAILADDLGALFGIELEDGSEKRAFGP